MAKHTSGPWTWDGEFKLGWYAGLASPEKYVGDYNRPQSLSKEESEANAKLITAAPDLLTACMAAQEYFAAQGRNDPESFPESAALGRALLDAIAKATT